MILRCLALNPQDRFATVRDVWRALNGESVSRRRKPWAWHRSRGAAIALAGGAAAIAALLAWGLFARYTVNPEALRRYNEGVSAFRDGGAFRANKLFELATRLDSGYAPAYAKLAETWIDLDYSDRANEALVRATEQRRLQKIVGKPAYPRRES